MKQRVFGQHCLFCSYSELLSSASVAKLVDTTGFDDVIVDDVIVVATEPLERNVLNQVNLFVEKDLEGLGLELPVSVPEPLASLDRNFRHVAGLVDQVQAVGDLVSRRIEAGGVSPAWKVELSVRYSGTYETVR